MLGEKIRNLRKENKISQEELAERLGVSRQSISLWENGQTQPTLDNIIAIADIFNVSTDILLKDCAISKTDNTFMSKNIKPKKKFKYPSGTKSGYIIAILLIVVFLQAIGTYVEIPQTYDWAIPLGFIEFCLISFKYMIIPMFLCVINKELSSTAIKIICAINSVMIFLISFALYILQVETTIFAGWLIAIFYYFINKHILLQLKQNQVSRKKRLITVSVSTLLLIVIVVSGIAVFNNIYNSNTDLDGESSRNEKETIIVAVEDDFAPFSYKKNGNYYGIHIDMANEMANRLGCNVEFVSANFDELVDGVNNGKFKLAFGIEETSDRTEKVMFTEPYYDKMSAIFRGETFSEYTNITVTLKNMIEDGTLESIFSKYEK